MASPESRIATSHNGEFFPLHILFICFYCFEFKSIAEFFPENEFQLEPIGPFKSFLK